MRSHRQAQPLVSRELPPAKIFTVLNPVRPLQFAATLVVFSISLTNYSTKQLKTTLKQQTDKT